MHFLFFIRMNESYFAPVKIWSINWIMLIKTFAYCSCFYYFSTKYFSSFWYCTLLNIRFKIIWYSLFNKFESYILYNPHSNLTFTLFYFFFFLTWYNPPYPLLRTLWIFKTALRCSAPLLSLRCSAPLPFRKFFLLITINL